MSNEGEQGIKKFISLSQAAGTQAQRNCYDTQRPDPSVLLAKTTTKEINTMNAYQEIKSINETVMWLFNLFLFLVCLATTVRR